MAKVVEEEEEKKEEKKEGDKVISKTKYTLKLKM